MKPVKLPKDKLTVAIVVGFVANVILGLFLYLVILCAAIIGVFWLYGQVFP